VVGGWLRSGSGPEQGRACASTQGRACARTREARPGCGSRSWSRSCRAHRMRQSPDRVGAVPPGATRPHLRGRGLGGAEIAQRRAVAAGDRRLERLAVLHQGVLCHDLAERDGGGVDGTDLAAGFGGAGRGRVARGGVRATALWQGGTCNGTAAGGGGGGGRRRACLAVRSMGQQAGAAAEAGLQARAPTDRGVPPAWRSASACSSSPDPNPALPLAPQPAPRTWPVAGSVTCCLLL
jgi:hypothetical protein